MNTLLFINCITLSYKLLILCWDLLEVKFGTHDVWLCCHGWNSLNVLFYTFGYSWMVTDLERFDSLEVLSWK